MSTRRPSERRGAARTRGQRANAPGATPARPPEETSLKRAPERRYTGWGDGIDRFFRERDGHHLPGGFPVASRSGVVTIPANVVARRPDALLLCTIAHSGPHCWPDGELSEEAPSVADVAARAIRA